MTSDRHTLRIANEDVRAKALHWITKTPVGWLVEFSAPRRTDIQSRRMWAMLGDISRQVEHFGLKYEPEAWKVIALAALGKEVRVAPSLHGNGLVPLGISTRRLTKERCPISSKAYSLRGGEGRRLVRPDPRAGECRGMSELPTAELRRRVHAIMDPIGELRRNRRLHREALSETHERQIS